MNAVHERPDGDELRVEAADWFTTRSGETDDVEQLVWACGLIQSAVDHDPDQSICAAAARFINDQSQRLSFAGHGRDVVRLIRRTLAVIDDEVWRFPLGFLLANELWMLNDHESADAEMSQVWAEVQRVEDPDFDQTRCLVGAKLGEIKLSLHQLDAAAQIASEIEPLVRADDNLQAALRIEELRFGIARERDDGPEKLARARACFEIAHAWNDQEGGTDQTRDAIAEAHFDLAMAYLDVENAASRVVRNLTKQLQIKLDIDKLGGVQSGLFNLGHLVLTIAPELGALMLGTADYLSARIGDGTSALLEYADQFAALAADPAATELALEQLAQVDPRLVPYAREAIGAARAD